MTIHPMIGVYVAHYDAPDQFTRMCHGRNGPEALDRERRIAQSYAAIRGNVAVEIRAFGEDGERRLAAFYFNPGETPRGYVRLTWFDPPSATDGPLGPHARKVGGWHYALWNRAGSRMMGGTTQPDLDRALDYVRKLAAERGMDDPDIEVLDTRPADQIADSGYQAASRGVNWWNNPYDSGSAQAGAWDAGHTRWRLANPTPAA